MLLILFSGLIILPLGLLIFGLFFVKHKMPQLLTSKKNQHSYQIFLGLGLAVIAVELFMFYKKNAFFIEQKQWMIISTEMAYFPFLCSLSVLAVAVIGYLVAHKKIALVPIVLLLITAGIRTGSALSADESVVLNRKLLNGEVSSEELYKILATDNVKIKITLASVQSLPIDIITQLSQDAVEVVRYYAVMNKNLPTDVVQKMSESDASDLVRKNAKTELKNRSSSN